MELIRHCLFDRKIHTSSSCSCNIIERNIIQGKFSTQLYIALQAMIICEENKRFMIAQIIFNTPVCMICVMSASRNHYPLSYDVLGCKSFPFKFIVFWKITKWTTIFASHCIKIYIVLRDTDTNTKDIRNNSNENVFVKWEILQPCNDTPFWWWILNGCTWPLMLLK